MSGPLSDAALAELTRLAEAATPGPWAWALTGEKDNGWAVAVVCDEDERLLGGQVDADEGDVIDAVCEGFDHAENAAYIAAANPSVVAALCSELLALRGKVAAAISEADAFAERIAATTDCTGTDCAGCTTGRMAAAVRSALRGPS